MDKKAKIDYDIHSLLTNRWSPRSFKEQMIEKEKLQRLFEAARWAPSAFNEQPWRFIVGVKGEGESYGKIVDSMVQFNKDWASLAPVLIAVLSKKTFTQTGKPNGSASYDTGQAVGHLTVQASVDGLHMHQMGGYDKKKIIEAFDVPEDFEPEALIAVGYIGEPELLPEEIKKSEYAERVRKPFSEFVFSSKFQEQTDLFGV